MGASDDIDQTLQKIKAVCAAGQFTKTKKTRLLLSCRVWSYRTHGIRTSLTSGMSRRYQTTVYTTCQKTCTPHESNTHIMRNHATQMFRIRYFHMIRKVVATSGAQDQDLAPDLSLPLASACRVEDFSFACMLIHV